MTRILRNSAIILSAFLSLAIVAQWIRSYHKADDLILPAVDSAPLFSNDIPPKSIRYQHQFWLCTTSGQFQIRRLTMPVTDINPPNLWSYIPPRPKVPRWPKHGPEDVSWDFARIHYYRSDANLARPGATGMWGEVDLDGPIFHLFLICSAPFTLWFIGRLRSLLRNRRHHGENLCATCGYDLRATPQGGRCPECGLIP